jgi:transcriptional regulator with XRE-family HTH domain
MDFGEWILNTRKEQELDIQTFAEKTRVNVGTISRIENSHTQPTVFTAFRLTEGLGVSLPTLIKDLGGVYHVFTQDNLVGEREILTLSDVKVLVEDFSLNGRKVRLYLADALSSLSHALASTKKRSPGSENGEISFDVNDIDKLLFTSSLYRFNLRYPLGMASSIIRDTYDLGGAVIDDDIGAFLRGFRLGEHNIAKSANNLYERIAFGSSSLERVKFNDLMTIDKDLGLNGKLLGIFWELCRFEEIFNPPVIRSKAFVQKSLFGDDDDDEYIEYGPRSRSLDYKLATLYVLAYRWYQYVNRSRNVLSFHKYVYL